MDMMPPQTPKMPPDLVLIQPSLRVSPTKLRKEIEGLEAKIEEEEDELKTLKNDYTILKADRSKPNFAEALVLTLRLINKTDDKITENKNRLSATKASLEKVKHEAELRNKGMLHLSRISSLIFFI
jgi:chromosome segregation ATPase